MKYLAIALALGDKYEDAGRGLIRVPLDGAIARFWAVTDALPKDAKTLVICTAGYSKKEPRVPQPERQVSLAGQLKRYVDSCMPWWEKSLVAVPRCWSTRNEVRIGIKYVLRAQDGRPAFAQRDEQVTVVIASNLSHLLRILLYAKLYVPRTWRIKLVRARHHFSLRSHVMEPLKICRDIWYIIRVLRRLKHLRRFKSAQQC